jgi:catechol 2,3-dioxygenase
VEARRLRAPPGFTTPAILYPDRPTLADALRRVLRAGVAIEGAADHGVSEAIYLRDPDGNGVELYRDRPSDAWPRTPAGELAMFTHPLDLDALLREAPPIQQPAELPPALRRTG